MYNTVFLDLDNTIFSFDKMYERAASEAIKQIIGLGKLGVDFPTFYQKFREIADHLYSEYEEGKRTIESYHDQRWVQSFDYFGVLMKDKTLEELNEYIQTNYLNFVEPYEGAKDFLQKLGESFRVGLITNGPVDMQMSKLIKMDIVRYFDPDLLVISEEIGISKPHPEIFKAALKRAGTNEKFALHIGDSIKHDILGANDVGMASALIHGSPNPDVAAPTYQFNDFFEASKVLLADKNF